MKSASKPVFNALRGRLYSAQAAAQKSNATVIKDQAKVSRLPSGAVVASLENNSALSRVAVLYNAGSRYEAAGHEGITHAVRSMANLATEHASGFGTTRSVQQLGGAFSVSTTREHMVYSLECPRDTVGEGVEILGNGCRSPAFKPWEVAETKDRLNLDLALLSQQPDAKLMEALHSAAYHNTLGNSFYMMPHKVGTFSPDTLRAWTAEHFTSANMAVVGVGVEHDELVKLVAKSVAPGKSLSGKGITSSAAHYYGGQSRVSNNSGIIHAAVVTEGVSLGSKDMIPLAVLQYIMGTGPSIKYSTNSLSKSMQAASKATSNPVVASCININYSDSGLFGFYTATHAKDADSVLRSLVAEFSNATKVTVSEADLSRAKVQLKAAVHYNLESGDNLLQDLGSQVALTGDVLDPSTIDANIDKVTAADIQAVAKKVINGKPTMAAVGDLSHTPYLEKLLV